MRRRASFFVPPKVPPRTIFMPRNLARCRIKMLDFEATKNPATVVVTGFLLGGDNRTRICDLLRVKQALYRLSYASIVVTRTGLEPVLPP